ncbi:Protein F17C8.9 [Aphelenchoides avenae]|nr:Protein F17C8.9 [Aphelenchus avenae]
MTSVRNVGIIGYGHVGQFLKAELSKNENFVVKKLWNRTEDEAEKVLPLTDITAENLKDLDLVIEVAHPDIVRDYAKIILEHADLFVGSPTALADQRTFDAIQNLLEIHPKRSVFVPSGAFWGAQDIQKMANLGILKGLTVTMVLPEM